MAVSSLGAGSGLDLNGILTSLMQVEQRPLVALQKQEASYQSRISALGSLKSTLSSLQSAAQAFIPATGQTAADKYATYRASVADSAIATASATSGAVSGSYSLEVSTLAQAQRLTTTPGLNTITTGGTLKIELGTLTGTAPATTYTADVARKLEITISDGATIEQVRDAINAGATDGRVSATVISGTAGKQLVVTSGNTGSTNVMRLSGIAGLDYDPSAGGSGSLSQATADGGQAASDATFKLNGIAATSSTNTVSNVLDGVTLNLLKTTTSATTLTVSKDTTNTLSTSINSFVKAFNDAAKVMKDLGYYDPATKTAGTLQGDSALRGTQNQIRSLLQTKQGGTSAYQTLNDIGVTIQADGTLKLDSTKLNKAIAADYTGVTTLITKIGNAFKNGIDGMVGSTGTLTAATDSTNKLIKEVGKRQTEMTSRLTAIEARYRAQFTSLDSFVSSMNKTSSYLTQQLANLPGSSSTTNNK